MLQSGENHISLAHRSKRFGSEPDLTESLVVVGVLACLLEAMGAVDVTVHKGAIPVFPHLLEEDAAAPGLLDPVLGWIFRWSGVRKNTESLADSAPSNFFDASDWPFLAKQVGNACIKDLMSTPTLAGVANRLASPPRSLQRHLSEAGLSYSQLLGEARRRMAAWRLLATPASLSEVGFSSGYADQAHFTRDFRTFVGLTPAQYRKEFATRR
jgi:AraC-like DNA-binding protein